MATLLHRLGRWCARRRWTVIGAWVALLILTVAGALTFMRPLANEFSIPDSRFENVLEVLQEEIPEAAGITGTVVFTSDEPFTDEQQQAVGDLVDEWDSLDDARAIDPFATQAELDQAPKELADGQDELEAGRAEIEEGESDLADAREDLAAGREELEAGEAELEASRGQLEAGREELEAGQAELDDQSAQLEAGIAAGQIPLDQAEALRAQVAAGQAQLDQGFAELEAGEAQLAQGEEALEQGRQEITDGEEQLSTGEEDLAAGREELERGGAELQAAERMLELTQDTNLVNEAGTVAMAQVSVDATDGFIPPEIAQELQDTGERLETTTGVQVDYSQEITNDLDSLVGPGEVVGLAVAAVVLIVMLGSLIAAGLPILMALVGVGVGLSGALALSPLFEMQSITPVLALMLGLAVGIDYSLFLINRHREQLKEGMGVAESIALAVGTSGNAVTFAGLTVIIALSALVLTGIPFLGVMGLVAAATVAIAVLIAITLTPAMLSLMGPRALSKKSRRTLAGSDTQGAEEPAHRVPDSRRGWAAWVQRRPWLVLVAVLAIVAGLAWPVGQLRLGLPDGGSEPVGSTAYQTYDTVREEFGAGANGPVVAVAQLDEPVVEDTGSEDLQLLNIQADIGESLDAIDGVEAVTPAGVSEDRDVLAFQVQPVGGPAEESTVELVNEIDRLSGEIGAEHGATIDITGMTVANIDISETLADALPVYLAVVVGLSLILLLLVFRSVLVPLLATAGFLLSIGAAFGAVVGVYQLGFASTIFGVSEAGPVLSFLPILLIGILFGLAMDYQLFLVSSIREMHVHGKSAREAVVAGFNQSARVVTAAAIIMISVFAGFVWAHLTMVRPIGLGLAVGVLIDAFVVRMTLTPAVLSLLGEKAWWIPRWLDRMLPNVDVEGARLERQLAEAGPALAEAPSR